MTFRAVFRFDGFVSRPATNPNEPWKTTEVSVIQMAVQISHSIYTEIPETAAIWRSEETSRGGVSPVGKA